ncbi:hypothetical protein OEZ85_011051 [Tetradesmus obliquus]|uniref:SF3 helicase domain-containing protein n=1 Tax=Tetradesmus obliquus TaxID=3088 RepID=A0ABY8TP32_TETOB|nr:hypothetical protein OEZ85_011051 [Tetradesmus obliquus]
MGLADDGQAMVDLDEHIESLDAKGLVAYVAALHGSLRARGVSDMTPGAYMELIGGMLGFDFHKQYSHTAVLQFCNYNKQELLYLRRAMNKHKLHEPAAEQLIPDIKDVWDHFYTVMSLIHYFNRAVIVWTKCKLYSEMLESPTPIDVSNYGCDHREAVCLSYVDNDAVKLLDNQILLLAMLDKAFEKGYRKSGDFVYERVIITAPPAAEGGVPRELPTHAWRPVFKMDEFVRRNTTKEVDIALWRCSTLRGSSSVSEVAAYLATCVDPELPTLQKDRNVFAFSNGTYVTWVDHADGTATDMFVPYVGQQQQQRPLHSSVVAANYFEQPMEFASQDKHWSDIPTPAFDKILDTQRFIPEVRRWLCVMLGRLLYDLGTHDSWQVIPFLKGVGGSGKSTLINDVCGIFYHKQDTAVLSNNCEKRFGLSGLVGHFLYLAPEVKHDLQLEQAEFQSMVSGEDVQINVKHQTASCITWTMPGILAGNELPGWVDNSGSIARRVLVFNFGIAVNPKLGDTELRSKLRAEIGCILQKCARAYLEAVKQVGSDVIWAHLPKYFEDQQAQLRMSTNSLEHFLGGDACVFGPEAYIPRETFMLAYHAYCKQYGLVAKPYQTDNYATTFARKGITYWQGYLRSTTAAVKQVEAELQRAELKLLETQAKCDAGIQQLTALKGQLVLRRNQAVEKQAARIAAYEKLLESMGRNKSTNALYQKLTRSDFGAPTLANKASSAAAQQLSALKLQKNKAAALVVSATAQQLTALKDKAAALAKSGQASSLVRSSLLQRKS